MSRLSDAVERGALIAYLMAGDPDVPRSLAYARAVLDGGADVLELGVPFSDPVADGPTIQRAGVRALNNKTRMDDVFGIVRELRRDHDQPIVLMSYYNPVLVRGVRKWAGDARAAGVDGVILPDVPLEESEDAQDACRDTGLDLVQLATPATPPARLHRLAQASTGFLYVVSTYGVTGARADLSGHATDVVARACAAAAGHVPVAVGFGVATAEHVRALRAAGAHGVIVGSALVAQVEAGVAPTELAAAVAALKKGV